MDFDKELEQKYLVVDFYATWCKPCINFAPTFDTYSSTYHNYNFLKIDVDDYDDIANKYDVIKVPTFIFFVEGKEKYRVNGANKDEIERCLKNMSNCDDISLINDF